MHQVKCTPLIGGNYVKVINGSSCSFGFQATKNGENGWITAGHCADGLVGNDVVNHSGQYIGTVNAENFYWGTSCDCAWIAVNAGVVDNRVYDVPFTHTVTGTTQASEQQNDFIYKTGSAGGQDFGVVSAINVSVYLIFDGEFVKNLVRSDVDVEHGDSGGPVVASSDRGNLYGIMTTHDLWGKYHTPIDQITVNMGVLPVLD